MLKLLQRLETELLTVQVGTDLVDKVRPITKIDEIAPNNDGSRNFEKYAICHEIVTDDNYKNRKGKFETPLFLNLYSNVDNNPDIAVLALMKAVKAKLDEVDLTDSNIKTYLVKYAKSNPQPEFNKYLQAWQSVIKVTIRWSEL